MYSVFGPYGDGACGFAETLLRESVQIISNFYNEFFWNEFYTRYTNNTDTPSDKRGIGVIINPIAECYDGVQEYFIPNYGTPIQPEVVRDSVVLRTPLMFIDSLVYRNNAESILTDSIEYMYQMHRNSKNTHYAYNGEVDDFSVQLAAVVWLKIIEGYIGAVKNYPNNSLILYINGAVDSMLSPLVERCFICNFGFSDDIQYRDPYDVIGALDRWFIVPATGFGTMGSPDILSLGETAEYYLDENSIFNKFTIFKG